MKKYLFTLIVLLLLLTSTISAGTTGKLMGRVTDAETGEPIIGANIIILDKQIGAASDEKGRYMIINIPAGTYNVRASLMGYTPTTVEGVRINLDLTTTLNFKLHKEAIGIEGITVKAERKLVEKDITGTEDIVTSKEMEHMPVDNIQEIVAVTAGAVGSGENLHIRGGRAGEVVYTVDGMSISNPVDGGFGMSLDMDAVSDMSIQTGGFTAEFGNAQSAIINLVTKSGGPKYSGKIQLSSDHIFNEGNNADEIKFSFGGPLLPFGSTQQRDKYTFYINTSGAWTDTRYKNYYTIKPNDVLWEWLSEEQINTINNIDSHRDTVWIFDIGDRFKNNYQGNAKVKFKLSPKVKLTFAVRGDRETYLPYSHSMKYSLEHYNHFTTTHNQQAFTWDQTISPKMFYTVRGSRFETGININSGVDPDWYFSDENTDWDNPFWTQNPTDKNYGVNIPGYLENGIDISLEYMNQFGEYKDIPSFNSPGTNSGLFWDDKTVTYTLRSDLTYQINQIHSAKTGIEIKYNEIYKDRISIPWYIDDTKRLPNYLENQVTDVDTSIVPFEQDNMVAYGSGTNIKIYWKEDFQDAIRFAGGFIDGYEAYPLEGAYYIQDKMEWEGMIVNAGIRFDSWYLGDIYKVKSDTTGEYIDAEWDYIEYIIDVGSDNFVLKKEKVNKFQLMVSPRLGISHPITDKDVLHFAYNYQSQLPPMQYVFTAATPEVGRTGTDVGNPNLKPETTITYEVGVEHQMGEDYLLDITLFYKNIYNLVSMISNNYALLPDSIAQAGRQYYLYWSNDYGSARGAEFTLKRRFSNFWGFNFGYTYSWANGRNSGVTDARDNLREFPLNWDVRHIGVASFDFRIPEDEEFYVFGLKMPDKFYASLLWRIQSGEPYTPVTPDPDSNTPLQTNSKRKPWTNTANLKISKAFKLIGDSRFKIFISINNLFDTKNINYVNAKTGKPQDEGTYYFWEEYEKPGGQYYGDINGAKIYMAGLQNPGIYSEGRKYTLGISLKW